MVSHTELDVINFLDRHSIVENKKTVPFNIKLLMDEFPDVDEFSLRLWHKEWMAARNLMLNIKFEE